MKVADNNGDFNKIITKMRGVKQDPTKNPHPLVDLLNKALEGDENPKLKTHEYTEEHIISPNDFKRSHTMKQVLKGEIQNIPGLPQLRQKNIKLNNKHHFIDTINDFKQRQRRETRKNAQLFTEIAQKSGYKEANNAMENNNTRSKGNEGE